MNKQRILIFLLVVVIIWKCCDYFLISKESLAISSIEEDTELSSNEIFKISIYYEALCSDSRNFILKQLVPTHESLSKFLILDFVPYGKAETFEKEDLIGFKCQHGATECLANKVHACALHLVPEHLLKLRYIACMIDDNMLPHEAGQRCAENLGINYNPILECVNNIQGSLLLKEYGERTHAVNPAITFIPTVEINGSLKIPLPSVLKDFNKELCKLFTIVPKECL